MAEGDWEVTADGLWIATRAFLLRRGYCCGNGCRNCPYRGTPQYRWPPYVHKDNGADRLEER